MANIEKRTSANGNISFRALVRMKGYAPTSATFKRLTDAKAWAQKTESAMREGRYFKNTEAKRRTVSDMIDRYWARIEQQHPKRIRNLRAMLEWWRSELGHCVLADLSKSKISEAMDRLSQRQLAKKSVGFVPISPARVNRYLGAFSHVCTVAVNEWEWLESHPVQKIKKMPEPKGRVRFLSDEERSRLLDACKNSKCNCVYPIVVLALSTGARLGEINGLRWDAVDFNRKTITLFETKNKETRLVPMVGLAHEIMAAWQTSKSNSSPLVFPSPTRPDKPYEIRAAWHAALKAAEIKDFRFHDLRHSAASYLAMNGASLAEIAEVLGHKTLQMVKRYAHLSEAHTSKVVAAMNAKIFGGSDEH